MLCLTRPLRRAPLALLPLAGACAAAQAHSAPAPGGYADAACAADGWARSDRAVACEVRTFVLAPERGPVDVESGNGTVAVEGTDTARAATVVARVRAWARTDADAARLLAAVAVTADGNALRVNGPRDGSSDDRGWAVDYTITAPRRLDVAARTGNGSVRVRGVVGRMRLSSGNGSLTLDGVGGDVEGNTGNGSVRATLAGRAWDGGGLPGARLDLHSGNGSALLRVPDGYSARLDVSTGNGGLTVDFPVTLQGRVDPHRLAVTLGDGGAPVRVSTGNGRVRVARTE
ncbi:hypothetical protein tb265_41670 [Gemmatimonadetes bacterium T265]|nr:hypothetical protein tb265_41670 [Gemmatimonadetes bacterium T265]